MSDNFYTTRELQDILNIDRTTIYRMADNGKLPAVKVGNQWRFPRRQVQQWMDKQGTATSAASAQTPSAEVMELRRYLPLECVQLIQDTFADALGVMILITDLHGQPVTLPSNPCGLFQAIERQPRAQERCLSWWAELARRPSLQPTLIASHLGLLCARGFIRSGKELNGMVIVGGIAPQVWPPSPEQLEQIAHFLDIEPDLLRAHLDEVYRIDPAQQQQLLAMVQRIADVMTHIASERQQICIKLEQIAALTQL